MRTVGISSDPTEIAALVRQGREWIDKGQQFRQPRLNLDGEVRKACKDELTVTENVLSNISNILINGSGLILDRVFNLVGFNHIEDVFSSSLSRSVCHIRQTRLQRLST